MPEIPRLTVAELAASEAAVSQLDLRVLAGVAGLHRVITEPALQKVGLALAGLEAHLRPGRVLVFGESETHFLRNLNAERRRDVVARMLPRDLPALLITAGLEPCPELVAAADTCAVPLLGTSLPTPTAIARIMPLLDDLLAPRELVHGVLLDVLGLGTLLVGESGIGKSECALDLVVRGYRLVADDAVEIRRRAESVLIGSCPPLTRHHMEVRGIGIINVRDLFGVAATRPSKRVELVVKLVRWADASDADRLGLEEPRFEILGLAVPLVTMPVAPGRTLATLVEVAARNHLSKADGRHAARRLATATDAEAAGADVGDGEATTERDR